MLLTKEFRNLRKSLISKLLNSLLVSSSIEVTYTCILNVLSDTENHVNNGLILAVFSGEMSGSKLVCKISHHCMALCDFQVTMEKIWKVREIQSKIRFHLEPSLS